MFWFFSELSAPFPRPDVAACEYWPYPVLLLVYVEALQNGVTIAKPGLKLLALIEGLQYNAVG